MQDVRRPARCLTRPRQRATDGHHDDAPPAARTSTRKHQAILDAAEEVFLRDGYLGTSMNEVPARSHVSKQTVYKHFGSKEALFVEIVTSMTSRAADAVSLSDRS